MEENKNKLDLFKCNSLELASFLMCKNASYVGIEKISTGFFNFVFENKYACLDLKQAYSSGAEASAMSLFEKRNFLLGEIKGGSQNEG